jgi:hypothetical protein
MGTYADDWRKFIRIVYRIVCMMKALLEREFGMVHFERISTFTN